MNDLAVRNGHSAELAEANQAQQYQSQTIAKLTDWANEARAAGSIAKSLCDTEFVPKHFRGNAAATTAAILTGFELGLPPMAALRALYVIGGTPAMYAATMRGLLQSQGHEIWTQEATATRVVVKGRRKGSQQVQESIWTIERAKQAELLTNAHYRKNPINMLTARATAEVCRLVAADLLYAVPYAVEELDDTTVTEAAAEAPKPKTRKMSRGQQAASEPDLDDAAVEMINNEQMSLLQVLFKEKGILDREERLRQSSEVVDRELGSANELTKAEAHQVIDWLKAPAAVAVAEPAFDDDAWLNQPETAGA